MTGPGTASVSDEPGPYRRVRVLFVRDDRLRLVQHRWIDRSYFWFIPGGGIKEGETVDAAAVREIWEEAGVHVRVLRRLTRWSPIAGSLRELAAHASQAPRTEP